MRAGDLKEHGPLLLLAVLVVGSALSVAGVPHGVLLGLGVVTLGGCAVLLLQRPDRHRRRLGPAIVLLLLSAYSLAQTIPLPLGWLEMISPTAADVWARSLMPMGQQTEHGSISLEPTLTTLEGLKWAIYAVAFQLAVTVARRRGAALCIAVVFGSAVLVALATIGHEIVGARTVFGVYQPRTAYSRVGPFLNANNLAGYLDLGVMCGLALLQSRKRLLSPWIVGAGAAIVVGVAFRAASRGGVLALALGLGVSAVWVLLLRRRSSTASAARARANALRGVVTLGAAVAIGLVLGILGLDNVMWAALLDESTEKIGIFELTQPMIGDFAWVGAGRGAFESVFLAYRPALATHLTYTHPENLIAQWASEWGLLVSAAALASLTWFFRPWMVGATRSALNATVWVGVVVLVMQNFVDLSLELPAVGVAMACALGALWGDAKRSGHGESRSPRPERAVRLASAILVGVSLVLAIARGARSLQDDRATARIAVEQAVKNAATPASARELLREQLARHPADYYFPQLGAALAWRTRSESPMPWLQRALERGPTVGRTHLLLAGVLREQGVLRQAMLELRYAVEMEPELARPASRMALDWSKDFAMLLHSVPEGERGGAMLDRMAEHLSTATDVALRDRLDHEAVRRAPRLPAPHERLALSRLEAWEGREGPCFNLAFCEEEILAHGRILIEALPQSSRGHQLLALLAIKDGRVEDAKEILKQACKLPGNLPRCLEIQLEVETGEALTTVMARYTAVQCTNASACATAWDSASSIYAGRGLFAQAQGAAEHAAREQPTKERWLQAAALAERANLPAQMLEALQNANRLSGGNDPEILRRLSGLRRGRTPTD